MDRYQFKLPPLYFLHIPKTAGTSLKRWLFEFYGRDEVLGVEIPQALHTVTREQINQARLVTGHFGWQMFQNFDQPRLSITWLRDPVKRAISNFRYIREQLPMLISEAKKLGCDDWIQYYEACSQQSFDDIMEQGLYEGFMDNIQTRHLADYFAGGVSRLVNDSVLEQAKQNLAKLSFVGLSEWMHPSIDLCSYQLGFPSHPVIEKLNATSRSNPQEVPLISEKGKKRLEEYERFDRQLYEWAKHRFERQFIQLWQEAHQDDSECNREFDNHPDATRFQQVLRAYDRPEVQARFRRAINRRFYDGQSLPLVDRGELNFADLVVQEGWHPRWPVQGTGNIIRWAGPNATSSVMFPFQPGNDYEVLFPIYNHAGSQFIEKISIFANGVPVVSKHIFSDGTPYKAIVWFLIPSAAIGTKGSTEIVFQVPDELVQADFGDKLKLSFATNGFHFQASAKNQFSLPFCNKNVAFLLSDESHEAAPSVNPMPIPHWSLNAVTTTSFLSTTEVCTS